MNKFIPPDKYCIEDEMVYRPKSNKQWVCFDDSDALIKELNKLYKQNATLKEFVKDFTSSIFIGGDTIISTLYARACKLIK